MRYLRADAFSACALAVLAAGTSVLSVGCGRQAIATTDALPVRRVVIYRNGVAYFERAGRVERDEVRFKMKPSEVGDFLATLAVMERGGSSVRAAAFPLNTEGDGEGSEAPQEKTSDSEKGLETVVLSLDGRAHDLQVGYVAESPVWRPSYRLVVRPNGEADLQAWGIVENLSGEDWKSVRLTLIAGAPLSFRADLGTPVIPLRPRVTDDGEVIAAVPRGETSLLQETPSAAPAPELEADAQKAEVGGAVGARATRGVAKAGAALAANKRAVAASPAPAPPSPRTSGEGAASGGYGYGDTAGLIPSPPRNLQSLAAVALEGGTTRYDLPLPVTIPDKSATMVMLLSRTVSGEALFLFAPDGGIPDSSSHPFRVARFTNGAGGVLERGPIAVFEEGAFLGQGMVDPLPPGATATVPFALERGIAIDLDRRLDEQGARVARIENSQLTVERDAMTLTKYRVRNGSDALAKVLLKHPRTPGARLFAPPPGTEDNVGTNTALVPTTIRAHDTAELTVDERVTQRQGADWFGTVADSAIKGFLGDARSDRGAVQNLAAAWRIRNDIVKRTEERTKLQQESTTTSSSTEETRRNLRAIEKNKTAEALRQKLTARLAEAAARLDDLNRRIVEVDAKLGELGVQFREAIRDIRVTVTTPPSR